MGTSAAGLSVHDNRHTLSLSAAVERDLATYRQEYRRIVDGWWGEDGTFGVTYPAFLVETYHYVKHSCDLMREARSSLSPTRAVLRDYLDEHIAEESGHEQWVLDDLDRLGVARADVLATQPLPETIALIGSQLYIIRFMRPAGLLGYVYLMESTPPNTDFLSLVQGTCGIVPEAMTFLLRHGVADVTHREELRDVLDTLIEPGSEAEAVRLGAVMGLSHLNLLFARLRAGDFLDARPSFVERACLAQSSAGRLRPPSVANLFPAAE